nr:class I SAM-dependent methyltransferase [Ectothiorhodospira shaposhnikovii]
MNLPSSAGIIDVGGGTSRLVDELLAAGYDDLTVLDLSRQALEASRSLLGDAGGKVSWLAQDITEVDLPAARFDLWHDRAVFHFLTEPLQRTCDWCDMPVSSTPHLLVPCSSSISACLSRRGNRDRRGRRDAPDPFVIEIQFREASSRGWGGSPCPAPHHGRLSMG